MVSNRQDWDKRIAALALPALGALLVEPLLLLADSIMVGHLGAAPLAGLGLASAILQTVAGLMVFLAYGTTPAVARQLGRGDRAAAIAVGIDGLWLALFLGLLLAVLGCLLAPQLIALFQPQAAVAEQALAYVRWAMLGLPALLLIFAASGLLRGLQDTRTPLWVALLGLLANVPFNYLFIYSAGLGLAGAAIGSVLAQWLMVAAYGVSIESQRRRHGVSAWPRWAGLKLGVAGGAWLLLRTASLRAAIMLTVYVATLLGPAALAGWHIYMTLLLTAAFALDALAIAAQSLIGLELGAANRPAVRMVLRRCLQWGVGLGLLAGLLLLLLHGHLGRLFTSDAAVLALLPPVLLVLACSLPVGAVAWVLDGVLMGAGDVRYLAWTGLALALLLLPWQYLVWRWAAGAEQGLLYLVLVFGMGFLGGRAVTLGWRIRGQAWMQSAS